MWNSDDEDQEEELKKKKMFDSLKSRPQESSTSTYQHERLKNIKFNFSTLKIIKIVNI